MALEQGGSRLDPFCNLILQQTMNRLHGEHVYTVVMLDDNTCTCVKSYTSYIYDNHFKLTLNTYNKVI